LCPKFPLGGSFSKKGGKMIVRILGVEYHGAVVVIWCRATQSDLGTFTIPVDNRTFDRFSDRVDGEVIGKEIDYDLEAKTFCLIED